MDIFCISERESIYENEMDPQYGPLCYAVHVAFAGVKLASRGSLTPAHR